MLIEFEKMRMLAKTGWQINLSIADCKDEIYVTEIEGFIGDSNCHHAKEYDPKDGHGFSEVVLDTLFPLKKGIDEFYEKCMKKDFGKKY